MMFKNFFAPFRQPTADLLAARELDEAERSLLKALTGLEYAQAMVNYNSATVSRLKARNQPAKAVVKPSAKAAHPDVFWSST